MPLHEIAASVRQGQVSAEALVAESLGRIERLDGPINAVVLTRGDGAFADAAAIDARVEAGEDPGPLSGLPLLVKDNEDAAGLPTTFGSLLREHAEPAERDCEVVSRFRAAGAIVVGKTNLPEFAFEGFTANRLFGETHDPWALDWSPGGSSGGSGAALAAGMAPLATGTDGGGSIRIPAAFCGLVGLKPTGGLIGHDPTPSWIDLSTKGPLASSVADAALLLEVMRGPTPVRRRRYRCGRLAPTPGRRASWRHRAWSTTVRSRRRSMRSFEEALAGLETATGLTVERVAPPFTEQIDEDWFTTVGVEELTWLGREVLVDRPTTSPRTCGGRWRSQPRSRSTPISRPAAAASRSRGRSTSSSAPTRCSSRRRCAWRGSSPTAARPARTGRRRRPPRTTRRPRTSRGIRPSRSRPAARRTACRSVMQITGPRFADDLVLAVGAAWEAADAWPFAAPGYTPFGE